MTIKIIYLALLPWQTLATLQQKQQQLSSLHSQLDAQINHFSTVSEILSAHVSTISSLGDDGSNRSTEKIYAAMDENAHILTTLISRTRALMHRVGEYNKMSLSGQAAELGMEERLENALSDEIERRDRFMEWKAALTDGNITEDIGHESTKSPYITLEELHSLFDQEKIIAPTEASLTNSLMEYTHKSLKEMQRNETVASEVALSVSDAKYASQFESIMTESATAKKSGGCIDIPSSVELVERELVSFYKGVDMVDYASYERGGSVVYTLTSGGYVPLPRNGGQKNEEDKAMETMYFEQQELLKGINHDYGSGMHFKEELKQWMQKTDLWEWYTLYKLGGLREYLPQDWERAMDWVYRTVSKGEWDDFTPRGAVDALVPDYVYHSLGLGNSQLVSLLRQTVGPEVAITAGLSKSGGEVGVYSSSKQLGSCYPLSMHADDDPALSYLSRNLDREGMYESISSLLVGPKYTVRLSQPIYIDAVSLEHRSFPVPMEALEGGKRGGESAPRHVRVVGFSPCGDDDAEDCAIRGFDITRPINLGSFEYHRVTVSGREDDYGGTIESEEGSTGAKKRRRRSTQTFAVNGGKWKPPAPLKAETFYEAARSVSSTESTQCSFDDLECKANSMQKHAEPELDPIAKALAAQGGGGECTPNYDDIEAVPSCGEDNSDPASLSTSNGGQRHAVAAVSFIIEENWGNSDYTCLYRVQVHGDAVGA